MGSGLSTAIDPINDGLATLREEALVSATVRNAAGDPDDASHARVVLVGSIELLDNGSEVGKIRMGAGTQIVADDATAFVKAQCRKRLKRQLVPATGTLSDADHTINVTQGDDFMLNGNPTTGGRIITVTKATGAPEEGETMTCLCYSVQDGPSNSLLYTFKRDDGSTIATMRCSGSGDTTTGHYWVTFVYRLISTGPSVYDWRLGPHSGKAFDGTSDYGILPGPSA
jgi:hypothetical protein